MINSPLGRHQKGMLNFLKMHKGLQSISNDSITLKIARSLVKRNLIMMNENNQISLA